MITKKPRVRFCWECGRNLWGNSFEELEVDGYKKILHKNCAKLIKAGNREDIIGDDKHSNLERPPK